MQNWNFLNKGFVDDFYVYVGPMIIGGKNTPNIGGGDGKKFKKFLKLIETRNIGPGTLSHYRLIK